MILGKVVRSNSHVDYICQVYGPGEAASPPEPEDYAFGSFARISLSQGCYLVGLIYDTILMNPDFGSLGPHLSPPSDLEVFSPDYLREKATLVRIVAIGQVEKDSKVQQGVPELAAQVDAIVDNLSEAEIRHFHQVNSSLKLAYAPLLLSRGESLAPHLLLTVIAKLESLFPQEAQRLAVLRINLAWQAAIAPVTGTGR